jgi:adenylate cyclase
MKKTHFYKILFLVLYWEFSALFYLFFESTVLDTYSYFYINESLSYNFQTSLKTAILVCLLASIVIGTFEVLYFNKLLCKKPLGITLLTKAIFYLFSIFIFTSLATILDFSFEANKSIFHKDVLALYYTYLLSPSVILVMVYWSLAVMSAIFVLHVNDKFGQGVLVNFLLGKYHHPKEENRIFMFLDLKSSTIYAEKLGHIKYSQLIQDCFYDLTDIVLRYDATIYQYVGDEIVLTWESDKGLKENNCISTFFAYESIIKKRGTYYNNNYGVIPEFKASLNMGYVTVAEVGELKKEIAYHGDVLNTAARIQEKCTEFNAKFLISENVRMQIKNNSYYKFDLIRCGLKLKGKNKPVCVFAVKNDHREL